MTAQHEGMAAGMSAICALVMAALMVEKHEYPAAMCFVGAAQVINALRLRLKERP